MSPLPFAPLLALAALLAAPAEAAQGGSRGGTAERLRVEYLAAPLAVDERAPRFSFARSHPARGAAQSAYRVTVSAAGAGGAPLWDSGQVASNSSLNIEYAGAPLASDSDYTWTATWFDGAGAPSAPAASTFSTALLEGVAGWGVQWVAPAPGDNMLRAEFALSGAPVRARLYISGLGYYRSFINGAATDAHVMGSFTTFGTRVLYDVWDVAPLLREGCNALGVMLGVGWYNQSSVKAGPKSLWALLSVDMADGSRSYFGTSIGGGGGSGGGGGGGRAAPLALVSAPGPVVFDEIYLGEHYDARLEQPGWASCAFANTSAWRAAQPTRDATQNASFNAHAVPILPDVQLEPVRVSEPRDGVFVVDFGRNMAGIATIRATCADGPQTIRVDYAETLQTDGTILQFYTYPYPLIMTSNFTCAGTGEVEEYTTLFSQYGFQYAQISNYPGTPALDSMTAYTVNSAVGQGSAFESSNALLNSVQQATRLASLSNLMDVPTDCPQRERRGWLGDGQLSMETVVHNFDAAAFYTKWLRDIGDAQYPDGRLGDTAPFYFHGGLPSDPAWGAAYPLIVSWASSYYADARLVERHYGGVRAYVESLVRQLDGRGLLPLNASQGIYGDWCGVASGGSATSCHFARVGLSSYYFLKDVEAVAAFAVALGKADDAARYSALAASTAAVFHAQLFNGSYYEDGFPVCQLAALDLGTAPPANAASAFATLVAELESGERSGFPRSPTGGIVFQKLAYPILSGGGRMDLALDLMLARSMPSVAFWFDGTVQTTPATTLWERWPSTATVPLGSFNHIMYGGYGNWLYQAVAGIGRALGAPSWSVLDVRPPQALPLRQNMSAASATLDTALGLVEVSWSAPDATRALCGRVEEDADRPNGTSLSFTCAGGGAFSSVVFASFGTPVGDSCPFAADPACDAARSAAAVAALCVGRSACTIPATDAFFGGDPCPNVHKALAVQLAGDCAESAFSLRARVPAGARATVRVPIGARAPSAVNVSEAGAPVWAAGAFVPGVAGVDAAAAADGYVSFECGAGSFDFELSAVAGP